MGGARGAGRARRGPRTGSWTCAAEEGERQLLGSAGRWLLPGERFVLAKTGAGNGAKRAGRP